MPDVRTDTDVLSERKSHDGLVTWQARRSPDRGRLEVVGIVAPSDVPVIIEPLDERQLRALLEDPKPAAHEHWICLHCGSSNAADRRWCPTCSTAS